MKTMLDQGSSDEGGGGERSGAPSPSTTTTESSRNRPSQHQATPFSSTPGPATTESPPASSPPSTALSPTSSATLPPATASGNGNRTSTPTPPPTSRLQVVKENDEAQSTPQRTPPPELLPHSNSRFMASAAAGGDDNSRYQFMSEPSLSEEGSDRILAPHRLPAGPNAFRRPSLDLDNEHAHRYRSFHGSVPNSPGNTSLSSWDTSPARPNVQLHFSSSLKHGPALPPVVIESSRNGERRVRVHNFPLAPRQNSGHGSNSSHQQQQHHHPHHHHHHARHHDDTEEDGSLGLPSLSARNRLAEHSNSGSGAESFAGDGRSSDSKPDRHTAKNNNTTSSSFTPGTSQEPSINMALSESEDDDDDDYDNNGEAAGDYGTMTEAHHTITSEEPLLDWEAQQSHSADDERTNPNPPQVIRHKVPRSSHRRTRSGDATAALLATGGQDWRGMTKDNIPIPEADDTDDSQSPVRTIKKQKPKAISPEKQTIHGNSGRGSSQQNNYHNNMDLPLSSQQQYADRKASRQNSTVQSSSSSSRPIGERQPSQTGDRQSFGQQYFREHAPPREQFNDGDLAGFVSDEQHNNNNMAYSMNYGSMMMPPPPPFLSQMYGGSPMMAPQQSSMSGSPMDPRIGGYPPPQPPPPLMMEPQMPGAMPVPYVTTWCPPSPHSYFNESNPQHFFNDSTPSFSPRNSYRRDSDGSFPIVEDVAEDEDDDDEEEEEEDDDDDEESDYTDDDEPMTVRENRMQFDGDLSASSFVDMREMERRHEDRSYLGSYQNVMRPHRSPGSESPFANLGKKSADKAPRAAFMPTLMSEEELAKYPTYICPRCKTRQREFFTVSDAPRALAEPSNYLAFYFGIYVIASLFIFGLEEGWKPLDCVYFAVITLTTAGLGDYVPTTDANKIICSIFIYFGVACIGLLLGSYIANMLDDRAYRDAKRKQIDSCPNCARLMNVREVAENISSAGKKSMSTMSPGSRPSIMKAPIHLSMRQVVNEGDSVGAVYIPRHNHQRYEGRHHNRPTPSTPHNSENLNNEMPTIAESFQVNTGMKGNEESPANHIPPPPPPVSVYSPSMSPGTNQSILGSPLTRQILGRQKHTRHQSFDISNVSWNPNLRKFSAEAPSAQTPPAISEDVPMNPPNSAPNPAPQVPFQGQGGYSLRGSEFIGDDNYESTYEDEDGYSEYSSEDESASTIDEIVDDKVSKIKAAKYVFLTLKQALVNSMVIIAVGCIGFVLTEEFNLVDSWYFTTVLLTTVGYGDIVPITNGGKLFATVYILVAGTVLINNMSMISMIPLELRRRRIERAVLTQFGDSLDDAALRELATGPLIQRLSLHSARHDGLDECTREMFSLAMLVRLGKVSEEDIRETFAVFRRLDVNDEGVLNSKTIIAGMIQKRRMNNARALQQSRANGSNVSATSRSTNNANGQFLNYWQMPVPLTSSTPPVFDERQQAVPLMPERPLTTNLQPPVPAQFMHPSQMYGGQPNETTCLLRSRSNSE